MWQRTGSSELSEWYVDGAQRPAEHLLSGCLVGALDFWQWDFEFVVAAQDSEPTRRQRKKGEKNMHQVSGQTTWMQCGKTDTDTNLAVSRVADPPSSSLEERRMDLTARWGNMHWSKVSQTAVDKVSLTVCATADVQQSSIRRSRRRRRRYLRREHGVVNGR